MSQRSAKRNYLCGHCKKSAGPGSLCCNKCGVWFHADSTCAKVTASQKSMYNKALLNPNGKRWFCENCALNISHDSSVGSINFPPSPTPPYSINDVMGELKSMKTLYFDLLQKFESQITINAELRVEVDSLKQEVDRLKNNLSTSKIDVTSNDSADAITTSTTSKVEASDIISELNDRHLRRNNIIVFGLIDNNNNNEDKSKLEEAFKDIACNLDKSKFFRLGKFRRDINRPIKLQFNSESDVKIVFKNISVLRDRNVQVRNDLTPMQLKDYKNIVTNLKDRLNKGEKNLRITYINGTYKIVPSKPKN